VKLIVPLVACLPTVLRTNPSDRIRLTRGASYLIAQTMATVLVYVIAFAVLARIISTKQMGIMTILQLVNATCLIFGSISIQQGVTKYVAENSLSAKETASAAYYQALRFTLLISIILCVTILAESSYLAIHLVGDASYSVLFEVLAFDVLLDTGILPVVTGALFGLQMFREIAIIGLIVGGIARQIIVIGLILLLHNFVGLVYGWVLSDSIAVVAYFMLLFRALGAPRFDFPLTRLLRYSAPLTLGGFASYAQTWFDRAMLVVFVPIAALGVYNAAWTAFSVILGVSSSIGSTLFSAFSSLQKSGELKVKEAVRLAIRYSNFILLPLSLGLIPLAKPALALFVGGAYVSGTLSLMIFSGTFALATVAFTVLSPLLLAREETGLVSIVTIISVGIGLGAAYLLLPSWGITGASAARGLTIIVYAILIFFVVGRNMSIELETGTVFKTGVASLVMVAAIVGIELLRYDLLLLPLYVAVGVFVYLLLLRILRVVDHNDVDLIRGFLGEQLSFVSAALSWILYNDRD